HARPQHGEADQKPQPTRQREFAGDEFHRQILVCGFTALQVLEGSHKVRNHAGGGVISGWRQWLAASAMPSSSSTRPGCGPNLVAPVVLCPWRPGSDPS